MRLLDTARRTGAQIPEMNEMLTELRGSGDYIIAELSRFRPA